MNVNFNFRANNRFVVSCSKHGEVDRLASKIAAEIRAKTLSVEVAAGTCTAAKGCKYNIKGE